MNSKLGDLLPPVVAGSQVTAAAVLTLLPFLLGLVEVIRGASPKSAPDENHRSAAARPRWDATSAPAGFHRSNSIPVTGNRKETTT